MNNPILKHGIFWLAVVGILTVYFGRASDDFLQAFYFTTFLLPVALATTYFFNYFLVPKYLVHRRYTLFGLYFFYTLIISLYLEMLVMTISFIVLANYQYANMNPLTVDLFSLTITVYLIVIASAFYKTVRSLQQLSAEKNELQSEKEKSEKKFITVRSDRKEVPIEIDTIKYIESLADYVKIHAGTTIVITKEKISRLQGQLPEHFIRVHRSFIVNKLGIDSFNKEVVKINGTDIPIGRTYKKEVIQELSD